MRNKIKIIVLSVCIGFILSGCGGDEKDTTATPADEIAEVTVTDTATAETSSEDTLTESVVLTESVTEQNSDTTDSSETEKEETSKLTVTEAVTKAPTTSKPVTTDAPVTKPAETEADAPETYTATVVNTLWDGDKDYFSITNVIEEGVYSTDEGLQLRVYYTTSNTRITTLRDFYPDEYGYVGKLSRDEFGRPWYESGTIGEYATCTYGENSDGEPVMKSGAYYDIPDGEWFFGTANYGNSFIVVVNCPEAMENGTVHFSE